MKVRFAEASALEEICIANGVCGFAAQVKF